MISAAMNMIHKTKKFSSTLQLTCRNDWSKMTLKTGVTSPFLDMSSDKIFDSHM